MKKMKFIIIALFVFFQCKTIDTEKNKITNLVINFEGNIDKPLPEIHFCKNCNEIYDFRVYQFEMNDDFFESITDFISLNNYSKENNNFIFLSVVIDKNNRKTLEKRESKLLIEELIKLSNYNKNVINEQLFKYLRIIKK